MHTKVHKFIVEIGSLGLLHESNINYDYEIMFYQLNQWLIMFILKQNDEKIILMKI
jgi:hypothetical protein